jgi:ribosomal protein S18 acetylase RimI-like enzyme
MRVTSENEPKFLLQQCLELNDLCFQPEERAPQGVFTHQFMNGNIFIVERVGKVVAFAIVSEKYGERYLWAIATDPNFRGRGFAGELLTEIEDWARSEKGRNIALTTHVDNPAQKLYFDKGYRVVKVLSDYYLTGNGLMMRRKLC